VPLPGGPAARLSAALDELGARDVQSLLLEGGPQVAEAMLSAGLVDRVAWFLAPLLIGGEGAPGGLGGEGFAELAAAPRLEGAIWEAVGEDVVVRGRLRPLPEGVGRGEA
jgi:diaminohydroxyphosphoribosylaminopyrimidine deaminase/5-amino-6-(5-phosphoribosylamino)uracil reductase